MSEVGAMSFRVLGVGIWRSDEAGESKPEGASIERRARRRATLLSRAMADACAAAANQAQLDMSQVPTVFGSALGETPTMISLMDQMCRGEEMSPMRFATSVHSSASGVVSISSNNKSFTTSLSADYDTVSAALWEAYGVMQTMGSPVVIVLGDDPSLEDFVKPQENFDRLAVALALGPIEPEIKFDENVADPSCAVASLGEISLPEAELAATLASADTPPQIARNPVVGALDLAVALKSGREGQLRLDRGRGSGFCVHVKPAS